MKEALEIQEIFKKKLWYTSNQQTQEIKRIMESYHKERMKEELEEYMKWYKPNNDDKIIDWYFDHLKTKKQ